MSKILGILALAAVGAAMLPQAGETPLPKGSIDPIVTGPQVVSAEELAAWQARHDRYMKCGLCGEEQAYPGD